MNLLYQRPLACGCLMFLILAALFLSFRISLILLILLFALCLAVAVVFAVLCKTRRALCLGLCLVFLGAALSCARTFFLQRQEAQINAFYETDQHLTAEVTQVLFENDFCSEYGIKITSAPDGLVGHHAVLRTMGIAEFSRFDKISGNFEVFPLSHESYFEGRERQYLGDGYTVLLVTDKDPLILPQEKPRLSARLGRLNRTFAENLRGAIGDKAGDLACAVLLGDRSGVDVETERDFRRAGLSHILAISGLHIVILIGALERFLYLLHFGKRTRLAICCVFCVFFCLFTGASISTVRACGMFFMAALAFYLKGDFDGVTALLLIAAIMAGFSPYVLFDVSFQMSFLATFGILTFGKLLDKVKDILPRQKGVRRRLVLLLRVLLSSLAISAGAMLALLPVQYNAFGSFSALTPIANLALLPIMTPFLISLLPTLAFARVPLLYLPFSALSRLLGNALLGISRFFAGLGGMVSLRYDFCLPLFLAVYAATILLLLVDLKNKKPLVFLPALCGLLAFVICLGAGGYPDKERVRVSAYQKGKTEILALESAGDLVFCDLSGASGSHWSAAYRQFESLAITDIEVVLIAQYNSDSPYSFSRLCTEVPIKELWIPTPTDARERLLAGELCRIAALQKTVVTVFAHDTPLRVFGNDTLTIGAPLRQSRSVKSAFALQYKNEKTSFCYMSGAYSEYLGKIAPEAPLPACEVLFLGAAGPVPHEKIRLPDGVRRVVYTPEVHLALLEIGQEITYYDTPAKFYWLIP